VKTILSLAIIAVSLLSLIAIFRALRTDEDRASAERPHSQDIPAPGWALIAAGTIGLPAWMYFHDNANDPLSWWGLAGIGLLGFTAAAILVILMMIVDTTIVGLKSYVATDEAPEPVSPLERRVDITVGALMLAYGVHGLWVNDLYIPGHARASPAGFHLHGVWAVIMFAAYFAMIAGTLVPLMHNSSRAIRKYSRIAVVVGIALTLLSVIGVDHRDWAR
jgi:hypothetical protein